MAILLCLAGLYVFATFSFKNREKLEANDYKIVNEIVTKEVGKEIKLSRVYECNETWEHAFLFTIYQLEMTSPTLGKVLRARDWKKDERKQVSLEDRAALGRIKKIYDIRISYWVEDENLSIYSYNGNKLFVEKSGNPYEIYLLLGSSPMEQ